MMKDQAGITLAEILVSAALVAMVVVTAMSVLLFGRASSQALTNDVDSTQQLRTALRQMAEDLTFAGWDVTKPGPVCYHTSNGDAFDGCQFYARVYQPVADRTANPAKWQDYPDWPGDLTSYPQVGIRYLLMGDSLIREVFDNVSPSRVYSSRAVVSGVIPYDPVGGTGSEIKLFGARRVRVTLRMNRPNGRGDRSVAQVSSEFFLADLR